MIDVLRELESALKEVGSGLSAIDKIGDGSYYEAAQKKVDNLLRKLPPNTRSMLPSKKPGMTNWSSFLREVQALRQKNS